MPILEGGEWLVCLLWKSFKILFFTCWPLVLVENIWTAYPSYHSRCFFLYLYILCFLSPYLILCFVLCFYISKLDVSFFFFPLSKNCVYYYYHYYSSSTSFKHNFLMGAIRGQMTSPLTTTVFLQYSIHYLEGCVVCIDSIFIWRILYSPFYRHHHSSSPIVNKFQVAS